MTCQNIVRWNNGMMLKFLDLYENQECLWNPKASDYKNHSARGNALASIAQAMDTPGLDIHEVKRKIRIVRTMYKRHHNLVARRMINNGYRPRLFWFERADSFLSSVMNEIKSPFMDKFDNDPPFNQQQPKIKKKRKDDVNEEKVKPANNSIRTEKNSSPTDTDDCTVFGQMVACELKKLNNKNKAIAKNKIQNVIFDLQLEEMSCESQTPPRRYCQVSASKSTSITHHGDVQLCEIDIE